MKNLFVLLLALPFFFAGCSDDDNDGYANEILGSWNFTKVAAEVVTDDAEVTELIQKHLKEEIEGEDLIFQNEGKVTYIPSDKEEYNGSYSVEGNILTLHGYGWSPRYDITISGNTLTMVYDNSPEMEYKIEKWIGAEAAAKVKVSKAATTTTYTKK